MYVHVHLQLTGWSLTRIDCARIARIMSLSFLGGSICTILLSNFLILYLPLLLLTGSRSSKNRLSGSLVCLCSVLTMFLTLCPRLVSSYISSIVPIE